MATAPGGVARPRELILTLAVQGKLVAQNPDDEPASALLKKIRAEKDRLIAAGKIKRDKSLTEIADEEKPFGLPRGWVWVRVSDLCSMVWDGELTKRAMMQLAAILDPMNLRPSPTAPASQTGWRCRANLGATR